MKAGPNRSERRSLFFWLMLPDKLRYEVDEWRRKYNPKLVAKYRPHVTIAKFKSSDPERFYPDLLDLAADYDPVRIHLCGHVIGPVTNDETCTILAKVARTSVLTRLQEKVIHIGGNGVVTPNFLHLTIGHVHKSLVLETHDFFHRQGSALFQGVDVTPRLHIQCNGSAIAVEPALQTA